MIASPRGANRMPPGLSVHYVRTSRYGNSPNTPPACMNMKMIAVAAPDIPVFAVCLVTGSQPSPWAGRPERASPRDGEALQAAAPPWPGGIARPGRCRPRPARPAFRPPDQRARRQRWPFPSKPERLRHVPPSARSLVRLVPRPQTPPPNDTRRDDERRLLADTLESFLLHQRLNWERRLPGLCPPPRVTQLNLMLRGPLLHQSHGARRQSPDQQLQ
jgi:hypothetical protein